MRYVYACTTLTVMNAENQQPCNCELCQPNWHLGRDGDFILAANPAPTAPKEPEPSVLETQHFRKLRQAEMAALSC